MADQPRMLRGTPLKVNKTSMEKDSTAVLRAKLELELHNKKQCGYESYQCSQLTIDGYKYCLKHILNDKSAPFKQCSYTYQSNGKRCYLPAPKGDKKEHGYCSEHALKTTLARNRQNSKNPPPLSAEALLTNLSHYVGKPPNRSVSSSSYISDEERNHEDIGEFKVTKSIDPVVDIDASTVYNTRCNEVLDLCSESESDVEPSTFSSVWHDANADSSDNESIDSEEEDVLKHANVYTAEEISLLTRDKLVRLQSLYIEQYRHLQYVLKERRRKYIHSLKREKETCCNISSQVRDNPKEQRLYRKLKQYKKYHRAYGEEAILNKKLHDLRAKISDGLTVKSGNFTKCAFTEGGVKCGEKVLPMAKHCRKHILEDVHQVLFKACGKVNSDVECYTPVEAIFDDSMCKLHMEIPLLRSYSQQRKESESDPDDTLELPPHYAMPTPENVKTEMIDYLPQDLPKMETLPSILFEESTESLQSTLQYSSEFTESFTEPSTLDMTDNTGDLEISVTDENPNCEIEKTTVNTPFKENKVGQTLKDFHNPKKNETDQSIKETPKEETGIDRRSSQLIDIDELKQDNIEIVHETEKDNKLEDQIEDEGDKKSTGKEIELKTVEIHQLPNTDSKKDINEPVVEQMEFGG